MIIIIRTVYLSWIQKYTVYADWAKSYGVMVDFVQKIETYVSWCALFSLWSSSTSLWIFCSCTVILIFGGWVVLEKMMMKIGKHKENEPKTGENCSKSTKIAQKPRKNEGKNLKNLHKLENFRAKPKNFEQNSKNVCKFFSSLFRLDFRHYISNQIF